MNKYADRDIYPLQSWTFLTIIHIITFMDMISTICVAQKLLASPKLILRSCSFCPLIVLGLVFFCPLLETFQLIHPLKILHGHLCKPDDHQEKHYSELNIVNSINALPALIKGIRRFCLHVNMSPSFCFHVYVNVSNPVLLKCASGDNAIEAYFTTTWETRVFVRGFFAQSLYMVYR